MEEYNESIKAIMKVAYDKIYDYIYYYGTLRFIKEKKEERGEEREEYKMKIKKEKYTDEERNKRIYIENSIYEDYEMFFSEPTKIIDNIYLGSAYNAALYKGIKEKEIGIIINMTRELREYYKEEKGLEYKNYGVYDNNKESMKNMLEEVYKYIIKKQEEEKEKNILIHCYMGASRSASVVIYYLMRKEKKSFDEAIEYVKKKRKHINPTWRLTKDLIKTIDNVEKKKEIKKKIKCGSIEEEIIENYINNRREKKEIENKE